MKLFPIPKKYRRAATILTVIIAIIVLIIIIFLGRHYFTRRGIRQMSSLITSYGILSPLAVIFLIFLSTAIPPLPLPVPLIEIAAGYIFGFWPGLFLVWFSQIISSLFAYALTRFIGTRLFTSLLSTRVFHIYRKYVDDNGAKGIFITRATLAAPFNIVSFLAGLTDISVLSFFTATLLGTIPESILYPLLGSIIKITRIRLWYVYIAVVVIGSVVPMYLFIKMNTVDMKAGRRNRKKK
ncbi:MAG TPA: VTT domain-containing protein [Patescibacteria group bacterium]|jgi:uncharacterized membrane protein YdjX (TVP38/TMEM64 family)|nr:VTT domain-containing protein [Patescibacteria group bacterium]